MDSFASLRLGLANRYAVEREVGAGGMARVFLARDLKHERDVAIKVLRPEIAGRVDSDRFLREIRLTAGLDHPNILALLDSGEVDGLPYYVLPFVRGESLRAMLDREGRLEVEDAVRIAREIASALHYAHARGIVHRDVKPENILLDEGRARLADFGIALMGESGGDRLTATGTSLGTPYYMSPEQAAGERQIDARSDVFSLGAVTYEMVTGEPPFSGSSAQVVIARILSDDPLAPRVLRPTLSAALSNTIVKAMEREAGRRFPNADAFSRGLEAANSGTSTTPVGAGRTLRALTWAALGSVAIVGVILVKKWSSSPAMGSSSAVETVAVDRPAAGIASKTIVVTLRNRPAAELVSIIASSMTPAGRVVADTVLNALVINEVPALIDDRARLARQLDSIAGARRRVSPTRGQGDTTVRVVQAAKTLADSAPTGKLRVALASFANASVGRFGNDLAPLRLAISDLLATDMASASDLELIEAGTIEASDVASAVGVGRRLGASTMILGTYIGDGTGRLRLSARLLDLKTGTVRRTDVIDGRQDSIFAPISLLSSRLRCALDSLTLRPAGCAAVKPAPVRVNASQLKRYSAALDYIDKKQFTEATRLLNEIRSELPNFLPVLRSLDKIAEIQSGARP